MDDTTSEIQALTSQEPTENTQSSFSISSDALTFLGIILPITIFAFLTVITIHNTINKQNRRIADAIGGLKVALIVSSLPIGMALALSQTGLATKAEKNVTPRNIRIEEITSTSFQITWRTSSKVGAGYRVSQNPEMTAVVQTRTDLDTSTLTHSYTVSNLEPESTYYIELFSDTAWFDDEGEPLVVTTLSP